MKGLVSYPEQQQQPYTFTPEPQQQQQQQPYTFTPEPQQQQQQPYSQSNEEEEPYYILKTYNLFLVESPPHLRFRIKSGILHNTTRCDLVLRSSCV
jgi:hypothetical protein